MKPLSIALAIYIVLLTLVPTISIKDVLIIQCSEQSCCMDKPRPQNPSERNKGCDKDCCLSITCCHYFAVISHSEYITTPYIYVNHDFYNSSETSYFNIFFEIWNPPKNV